MEIEERTLSYEQFMKGVSEGGILVDIREEEQTRFGTIPGAVMIPALQPQKLYQLPEDKKIFLYCQKGEISAEIFELMLDGGYDAYQLEGGYGTYLKNML